MTTYFLAFLIAFAVGTVLTFVVREQAIRRGWVAQSKSSRNVHVVPIPRLGGVAIVIAFFAPLLLLFVVESWVGRTFRSSQDLVLALFGGGLAIAALGIYDDLVGSGAKLKLLVQTAVALTLFAAGLRIEQLANPFGDPLSLGVLALPVTVLWVVGVINAMNLIDGLDGLAGGVAFFAVATNFVLALSHGDILMALLMAALGGAVLGFLVFNFNPASIFMGDTGSMFLGFVVAVAAVKTSTKSGAAVALLVPILSLGLPIMDTLLAMVRRTLLGRPMFSADKEHIHHRLMSRMVLSHRNAVLVMYGFCCFFTVVALAMSFASGAQAALLLTGICVVVVLLMRQLGYLNLRQAKAVATVRQRNLQLRSVVKGVIEQIDSAGSVHDLWKTLHPVAETLGMARMQLMIEPAPHKDEGLLFETLRPTGSTFPLELHLDLEGGGRKHGKITVTWKDGRSQVDRDEELALELITDATAKVVERFHAEAVLAEKRVIQLRRP